jgi:hypothetical protein
MEGLQNLRANQFMPNYSPREITPDVNKIKFGADIGQRRIDEMQQEREYRALSNIRAAQEARAQSQEARQAEEFKQKLDEKAKLAKSLEQQNLWSEDLIGGAYKHVQTMDLKGEPTREDAIKYVNENFKGLTNANKPVFYNRAHKAMQEAFKKAGENIGAQAAIARATSSEIPDRYFSTSLSTESVNISKDAFNESSKSTGEYLNTLEKQLEELRKAKKDASVFGAHTIKDIDDATDEIEDRIKGLNSVQKIETQLKDSMIELSRLSNDGVPVNDTRVVSLLKKIGTNQVQKDTARNLLLNTDTTSGQLPYSISKLLNETTPITNGYEDATITNLQKELYGGIPSADNPFGNARIANLASQYQKGIPKLYDDEVVKEETAEDDDDYLSFAGQKRMETKPEDGFGLIVEKNKKDEVDELPPELSKINEGIDSPEIKKNLQKIKVNQINQEKKKREEEAENKRVEERNRAITNTSTISRQINERISDDFDSYRRQSVDKLIINNLSQMDKSTISSLMPKIIDFRNKVESERIKNLTIATNYIAENPELTIDNLANRPFKMFKSKDTLIAEVAYDQAMQALEDIKKINNLIR